MLSQAFEIGKKDFIETTSFPGLWEGHWERKGERLNKKIWVKNLSST
jgi:hypothetical protein